MKTRWLTAAATAGLIAAVGAPAVRAQGTTTPLLAAPPTTLPADTLLPAHPASDSAWSAVPAITAAIPAGPACPAAGDAKQVPFTPFMLGDFIGPVANLFTQFKIAEGESPRPIDRVFFKYNYYDNVDPTRWRNPTQLIHDVGIDQYTIGMEKTFFDGLVSLGLRLPFYTIDADPKCLTLAPNPLTGTAALVPGGPGFDESYFGNLIAIAKALLWDDRESGSALSAGAVISIPTAGSLKLDPGLSALMYVQPFSGFILTDGDAFLQGFTSMTLPVARPEAIVSFTDLGVGYYIYKDNSGSRWISAVAPTFEVHYTAPLRQVQPSAAGFGDFGDNIRVHNTIDLTFGSTFEIAQRATLGVGLAVPVTGQRPFDWEGLIQLNMMF
ncbi:MAG TPA: hypothetical protein VH120_04075 [Gemmataceae bacterium]|jgi:hypothetical protein|nr:hypothetical protein [Gemmataceae bacterium]